MAEIASLEDVYRVMRDEIAEGDARRLTVSDALVVTGATSLSMPRQLIEELGLLPIRSGGGHQKAIPWNKANIPWRPLRRNVRR